MLQLACSTHFIISNPLNVFSVGVPSTGILYNQGLATSTIQDWRVGVACNFIVFSGLLLLSQLILLLQICCNHPMRAVTNRRLLKAAKGAKRTRLLSVSVFYCYADQKTSSGKK